MVILDADDSSSSLKTYLTGQNFNDVFGYCRNSGSHRWQTSTGSGGFGYTTEGGYPQSVVFDRDGNIRIYAIGAIDGAPDPYLTVIKQLLGVS